MTVAKVREKLHEFIDHADDKKVKAMFTLLENEIEWTLSNKADFKTSIDKAISQSEKGLSRP